MLGVRLDLSCLSNHLIPSKGEHSCRWCPNSGHFRDPGRWIGRQLILRWLWWVSGMIHFRIFKIVFFCLLLLLLLLLFGTKALISWSNRNLMAMSLLECSSRSETLVLSQSFHVSKILTSDLNSMLPCVQALRFGMVFLGFVASASSVALLVNFWPENALLFGWKVHFSVRLPGVDVCVCVGWFNYGNQKQVHTKRCL